MTIYFIDREREGIMIGLLIIALVVMMFAYYLYRRYFFHKTPVSRTKKPHFTLKIESE